MGYEIDFLPVGEESRSGDAIALRFGDLLGQGDQATVVVDGGFKDSGEQLVEHIRDFYDTNRVDLVVSTHPDSDHINGLSVVLEAMDVGELWMHRPSVRARKLERLAGRIESKDQREAFKSAVESAEDLEEQANEEGIPITEPFTGTEFASGMLRVLGPTPEFYEEALEKAIEEPDRRNVQTFFERAKEAVSKVAESWGFETLSDEGGTSTINNTSAIILFSYDDMHSLLTADAGIPALERAADHLERSLLDDSELKFVQVPHHGSKRNVGPTVLDRLLGDRVDEGHQRGTAYVSAAEKGEPKHPSKKVTNAFLRRGYKVYSTQGNKLYHNYNSPERGWSSASPLPFYNEVEE